VERSTQPLAEVFGHLTADFSERAKRYRKEKLCPFNNKVPNCTKDKAQDPLGVCSIHHAGKPVITCPVRFREDWLITGDAADFFFSDNAAWTSLTEVRLTDYYGKAAGNIDVVLAAYDEKGKVYDFGSLEIQAVYISGNVRAPFSHYMSDCEKNASMGWASQSHFPRPDYLSSSRKRLAPQLLFKGGILHAWRKKMAVALDSSFYETLPKLEEVKKEEAEIAWLVYDLSPNTDERNNRTSYSLNRSRVVYTKFKKSLDTITSSRAGDVGKFVSQLQREVDKKLELPPTNRTLGNPLPDN